MADMNYRTPFEYPTPKALIKRFLIASKQSSPEKKVWRDLLNSEAYNKFKDGKKMVQKRHVEKEEKPPKKKKK